MSPARSVALGRPRLQPAGSGETSRARRGRLSRSSSVAALSWWYFAAHRQPSANRYHGLVLGLGWIGTSLALLAAALSIRKRVAYQGVGRMSAWLTRAHLPGHRRGIRDLLSFRVARGRPAIGVPAGFFLAHRGQRADGLVVRPQAASAADRHRGEPGAFWKTCLRCARNVCKGCSSWQAAARPTSAPWWKSA